MGKFRYWEFCSGYAIVQVRREVVCNHALSVGSYQLLRLAKGVWEQGVWEVSRRPLFKINTRHLINTTRGLLSALDLWHPENPRPNIPRFVQRRSLMVIKRTKGNVPRTVLKNQFSLRATSLTYITSKNLPMGKIVQLVNGFQMVYTSVQSKGEKWRTIGS